MTAFQTALRIKPDYEAALVDLGYAYIGLKKYQEAVRVLQQAKSINATNVKIYQGISAAYLNRAPRR